jgi:hypothetical protein
MRIAKTSINPVIMRGKQDLKLTKGRNFMVLRARARWCVILQAAVAAIGLAVPAASSAGTFVFDFAGPGVSGRIDLSYGPTTDAKYPSPGLPDVAYEVTAISGFFTDTNNGLNIVNAPITGLVPLNNLDPDVDPKPDNLLAPNNFSKFFPTESKTFTFIQIDQNQVEETNEKYQFTWNGKQNAIAHAQKPSLGTLREDKASSKNFDSTENLYIEGDNLEVLKLLQKTYQGKIRMIYIDPPYNTGNDFVYKDDFKDSISLSLS